MWCYKKPKFELLLVGELQKQQELNMLCDTVLCAGGICVPVHSCVLSAASPQFSHKFSAAPCLPAGQSHLIDFGALSAGALLKLVGLLYSGELEGEGELEREEVFTAAYRLGIHGLMKVCKEAEEVTVGGAPQDRGLEEQCSGRIEVDRQRQGGVSRESVTDMGTQTHVPVLTDRVTDMGTQTHVPVLTDRVTDMGTQTHVPVLTDRVTDMETQTHVPVLTDRVTDMETQTHVSVLTDRVTDMGTQTHVPVLTDRVTDMETQTHIPVLIDGVKYIDTQPLLMNTETQTSTPLLSDRVTDRDTQTSSPLLMDRVTDMGTRTCTPVPLDRLTESGTQTYIPILLGRVMHTRKQPDFHMDRETDTETQTFMAVMMDSVSDTHTCVVVQTDSTTYPCALTESSATLPEGGDTDLLTDDSLTGGSCATLTDADGAPAAVTFDPDAIAFDSRAVAVTATIVGLDAVAPGPAPAVVASETDAASPVPAQLMPLQPVGVATVSSAAGEVTSNRLNTPEGTCSSALEGNPHPAALMMANRITAPPASFASSVLLPPTLLLPSTKNDLTASLPVAQTTHQGPGFEEDPGGRPALVLTSPVCALALDLSHHQLPADTASPQQASGLQPDSAAPLMLGTRLGTSSWSPGTTARQGSEQSAGAEEGSYAPGREDKVAGSENERFDGNIVGFIDYFLNSGSGREEGIPKRSGQNGVAGTQAQAAGGGASRLQARGTCGARQRRGRPKKVPTVLLQARGTCGALQRRGRPKKVPTVLLQARGTCGALQRRGRPKKVPTVLLQARGTCGVLQGDGPGHPVGLTGGLGSHVLRSCRTAGANPREGQWCPLKITLKKRPGRGRSEWEVVSRREEVRTARQGRGVCVGQHRHRGRPRKVAIVAGRDAKVTFPTKRGHQWCPSRGCPLACLTRPWHILNNFSFLSVPEPPTHQAAPLPPVCAPLHFPPSPHQVALPPLPPDLQPAPCDESTEQLEKLLEDMVGLMMGLDEDRDSGGGGGEALGPLQPCPELQLGLHGSGSAPIPHPPQQGLDDITGSAVNITASEAPPTTFTGLPETGTCHVVCTLPPSSTCSSLNHVAPSFLSTAQTGGVCHEPAAGSPGGPVGSSMPCAPVGCLVAPQVQPTPHTHSSAGTPQAAALGYVAEACTHPSLRDVCLDRGVDADGSGTSQHVLTEPNDILECILQSLDDQLEPGAMKEGTQYWKPSGPEDEPAAPGDAGSDSAQTACNPHRSKDSLDVMMRTAGAGDGPVEQGVRHLQVCDAPVRDELCPAQTVEGVSPKHKRPQQEGVSPKPAENQGPSAVPAQGVQLLSEELLRSLSPIPVDELPVSASPGLCGGSLLLRPASTLPRLSGSTRAPVGVCREGGPLWGEGTVGEGRRKSSIITRSQSKERNGIRTRAGQALTGKGPVKRAMPEQAQTQEGEMGEQRERKHLKYAAGLCAGEQNGRLSKEGVEAQQESRRLEKQYTGAKDRVVRVPQNGSEGDSTLAKGNVLDASKCFDFAEGLKSGSGVARRSAGHVKKSALETFSPLKRYFTRLTKCRGNMESKQVTSVNHKKAVGSAREGPGRKGPGREGPGRKGPGREGPGRKGPSELKCEPRERAQKGVAGARLRSGEALLTCDGGAATMRGDLGVNRQGNTEELQTQCSRLLTRGKKRKRKVEECRACQHVGVMQRLPEKQKVVNPTRATGPHVRCLKTRPHQRLLPELLRLEEDCKPNVLNPADRRGLAHAESRQPSCNVPELGAVGKLSQQGWCKKRVKEGGDEEWVEGGGREVGRRDGVKGGEDTSTCVGGDDPRPVDSGPMGRRCRRRSGRALKEHIKAQNAEQEDGGNGVKCGEDKPDVGHTVSVERELEKHKPTMSSSDTVTELQQNSLENSRTSGGHEPSPPVQQDRGKPAWGSEQGDDVDDIEVDVLYCSSPVHAPFSESLGGGADMAGFFKQEDEKLEGGDDDDDEEGEIDVVGED